MHCHHQARLKLGPSPDRGNKTAGGQIGRRESATGSVVRPIELPRSLRTHPLGKNAC